MQQERMTVTEMAVATGPQIRVVVGRGASAQTVDLTFAELDEFHGGITDASMLADDELLDRLQGYLVEHGRSDVDLSDRKVTRPGTGSILVGPESIFGSVDGSED